MPDPSEQPMPLLKRTGNDVLEQERIRQERMRSVRVLLEHLIRNEQTTVRMILDYLYDIGSVNLINQKVHYRPANQLLRWMAQLSKPLFKVVALRWFNRNCPQLVTDWLATKVAFKPSPSPKPKQLVSGQPPSEPVLLIDAERHHREIRLLQAQVNRLKRLLIVAIALLGGTALWLMYERLPIVSQLVDSQLIEFPFSRRSEY